MDTKKHYKMYKNGKNWCYAVIATLAIAFGAMVSAQPAAQADTVSQPETTTITSTNSAASQASTTDQTTTTDQTATTSQAQTPSWQPSGANLNSQQAQAASDQTNHGSLDSFSIANGNLQVSGWNASNQDVNYQHHFVIVYDQTQSKELARQEVTNTQRNDVAKAYPGVYNSQYAGFNTNFNFDLTPYLNDQLQVISRYSTAANGEGQNYDMWFGPIDLGKSQKGYAIDSLKQTNSGMQVTGWMADDASATKPFAYVFLMKDGKELARTRVNLTARPDVAQAMNTIYGSAKSGFTANFNVDQALLSGNLQVMMRFTDDAQGNGNFSDQYSQSYATNADYADQFSLNGNTIHYAGWHAATNAKGMQHQYIIVLDLNGKELYRTELTGAQKNITRNDITKAYPWIADTAQSGFSVDIPVTDAMQHKGIRILHRYTSSADGNSQYVDFISGDYSINSGWQGDYYYNPTTGQKVTGQQTIDGKTYLFGADGKLQTKQQTAVNRALSMVGTPYVWGGNRPGGFDCSGLVQWAYGLSARTTYQQQALGVHHYDVANAPLGALLFFGSDTTPGHVAISLGNGRYVHAPQPGQTVTVTTQAWYAPSFYVVL
ncbi:NlpC/P60 family protein [Limosilactobacillus sp.]|uniref:NlpC/P60 family protein n=1 Tax=Limosilactobacillus sp. TaxID=2773925 RepID=UPI003F109CA2